MYVHPFASNIWDWQCNMMLQRACSSLQVKIKWCKCHGIWSWWKSWREVEEYLKRWSNLGWGSKHNGRFTLTYQNVHQSLSVGSTVTSINYYFLQMTVTLFFADWEDAYVYWCSCQFYELFYFFFLIVRRLRARWKSKVCSMILEFEKNNNL